MLEREFKIPLAQTPELTKPARMLSETPPFPFSKKLYESARTVFNYVACDNKFEESFAQFLHNAEDVETKGQEGVTVRLKARPRATGLKMRHH
ncbi:MAG: hypothetical protein ACE5HO_20130 [bacterium]